MPESIPESRTRLGSQEKILLGFAAALGAGCRTCVDRLRAMAADARVPGDAVEHALAEGLRGREAATATLRAKAASVVGRPPETAPGGGKEARVAALCRLAAAVAANSAPDALRYAAAARTAGAAEAAIEVAIGIGRSVRARSQEFSDAELRAFHVQEIPCPTELDESRAGEDTGGEAGTETPRPARAFREASVEPCSCAPPAEASCECAPPIGASGGPRADQADAGGTTAHESAVQVGAKGPPWQRALRWIESLPLGDAWLGLGLAAAIAALYLGWCAPSPDLFDPSQPLSLATETRIHLTIAVLIGFFVAATRSIDRHSPLELSRLQPLTCCSRDELARIAELNRVSHRRHVRLARILGALVGLLLLHVATGDVSNLLQPRNWDAHTVWSAVTSALLFSLMGRAAYETVVDRRLMGRVTREISEIDLLDQQALAPFARQGLRRAFLWAGGSTIASLLAIDAQRLWPLLAVLAVTLLLATLAFLEPARSIRARLRNAKRRELARARAEIQRAKEAALRHHDGAEASRLPGLLAYEYRIAAVREWPFDTPTLARFAALALLATGSWLGGAVVERILGAVLE